jgi:uracil-DNA glycosylase
MLKLNKTSANSGVPIFQTVLETAQGGFTLNDNHYTSGTASIKAGTPIGFDESTRLAKVCKIATAHANATNVATTYQVKKGHPFKVGSSIKVNASGAQTITVIDTSNADYDVLTVGTTLGVAVTAGDVYFIDDAGYQNVKGLLYADVAIPADGEVAADVVLRGTVYERRLPSPVGASVKAKIPQILFSNSF